MLVCHPTYTAHEYGKRIIIMIRQDIDLLTFYRRSDYEEPLYANNGHKEVYMYLQLPLDVCILSHGHQVFIQDPVCWPLN